MKLKVSSDSSSWTLERVGEAARNRHHHHQACQYLILLQFAVTVYGHSGRHPLYPQVNVLLALSMQDPEALN
jgi:hypothetical protein